MDRRGFLGACLAAFAAPAIVRADSLMRCIPTETTVVGLDLAAGADFTAVMEIGRIDSFRFILSSQKVMEEMVRLHQWRDGRRAALDREHTRDVIHYSEVSDPKSWSLNERLARSATT